MNDGATTTDELGILVGVAKPDQVTVEARRPVSIGEYVILKYGRGKVLGLVERSSIASDALGEVCGAGLLAPPPPGFVGRLALPVAIACFSSLSRSGLG